MTEIEKKLEDQNGLKLKFLSLRHSLLLQKTWEVRHVWAPNLTKINQHHAKGSGPNIFIQLCVRKTDKQIMSSLTNQCIK